MIRYFDRKEEKEITGKDIIEKLGNAGFNTGRIRREGLLSESTLQKLRNNAMIRPDSLGAICCMLRCQPGDLIENLIKDEEKVRFFN